MSKKRKGWIKTILMVAIIVIAGIYLTRWYRLIVESDWVDLPTDNSGYAEQMQWIRDQGIELDDQQEMLITKVIAGALEYVSMPVGMDVLPTFYVLSGDYSVYIVDIKTETIFETDWGFQFGTKNGGIIVSIATSEVKTYRTAYELMRAGYQNIIPERILDQYIEHELNAGCSRTPEPDESGGFGGGGGSGI